LNRGGRTSLLLLGAVCAVGGARVAGGAIVAGADQTKHGASPGGGFAYWNNLGHFPSGATTGGSGVYLGDGWVLTASHVQGGNDSGYTFAIPKLDNGADAVFHPVTASQRRLHHPGAGWADLSVFRLQDDARLANLPKVQFGQTPAVGTDVKVVGSGYNRAPALRTWQLADPSNPDNTTWTEKTGQPNPGLPNTLRRGYSWDTSGFAKRWGDNTTVTMPGGESSFAFTNPYNNTTTYLFGALFDQVDGDSQVAPGDSGGGVFVGNRLVGLNLLLGDDSNGDGRPHLGQRPGTAVFGNVSFYAGLGTYVDELAAITGLHPSIDGDANLDGVVDESDLRLLNNNLNTGTKWSQGDFNLDGIVNFGDFQILERSFGDVSTFPVSAEGAAPVGVPEPGGVAGVVVGAGALLARRRRRR
jgi:hypothetical protein